jgi:hypothetical protein
MTMTAGVEGTPAGVVGDFELASPETRANEQIKNTTRNDGCIRCTVTGTYISTDETDKTKVAQKKKSRKWYWEMERMGGAP